MPKKLSLEEKLRRHHEDLGNIIEAEFGGAAAEEEEEQESIDVSSMKKVELHNLLAEFAIDPPKNLSQARKVATVLVAVRDEDTEELELEDINVALKAAGFKSVKNSDKGVTQLSEYISGLEEEEGSDDEEEEEEEPEEEETDEEEESEEEEEGEEKEESEEDESDEEEESDDEEEEESDDEEETDDEEEGEEIDPVEIAKAAKLPTEKKMTAQVTKFNKAAKGAGLKPLSTKSIKTAYRKLLEKLVTEDGEIAEWGEAYFNTEQEACCCGLPLEDVEDVEEQVAKCRVTGKYFTQGEEEGTLEECELE